MCQNKKNYNGLNKCLVILSNLLEITFGLLITSASLTCVEHLGKNPLVLLPPPVAEHPLGSYVIPKIKKGIIVRDVLFFVTLVHLCLPVAADEIASNL